MRRRVHSKHTSRGAATALSLSYCLGQCLTATAASAGEEHVAQSENAQAAPATSAAPGAPETRRDERSRIAEADSPQRFALELRFGPYLPDVDDSFAGAGVDDSGKGPYEYFFGNGQNLYVGAELDWQLLRVSYLGTLGLGAGLGYTSTTAPNLIPGNQTPDAEVDQPSSFSILPMYAVAVLRIDEAARRYPIPLVPYAKFGLGYALWWVNDGVGLAKSPEGRSGRDGSIGTQAALGGMLLLDFFEPAAARGLDIEMGINNSYLFFEWAVSSLGSGDQMKVGTNTWATGLALEF